jgi:hypothetical protein
MRRQRSYFEEMTELNPSRENLIKKRKQALTKINSLRKEFEKKDLGPTAKDEYQGKVQTGSKSDINDLPGAVDDNLPF